MRILQLSKKNPFPPRDGESVAILAVTEGLCRAGHEVSLLCMNTPKLGGGAGLPDSLEGLARFEAVFVNTNISAIGAAANLLGSRSYNIQRFYSKEYESRLVKLLAENRFDIIHLEGVYLSQYISVIWKHSAAPIAVRLHNLEYEIWERLALQETNFIKKRYLKLLARRLKDFEREAMHDYDALVPISKKDLETYRRWGCRAPSFHLPASVSLDGHAAPDSGKTEFPSLYFLGSLDWMPNQEGLQWLVGEVLPAVFGRFPKLKFYVAGRNMPDWMKAWGNDNIVILGEIDDAAAFIQSKSVAVVPLFSGSGMRVKIIEAMAAGKPVIATSIAAEGVGYTNGTNILIADQADEFAHQIEDCISNEAYCRQLGANARKFVAGNHSTGTLMQGLSEFYQNLCKGVTR